MRGGFSQNIHQRRCSAACGGEQQDIHQRRIPEQDGAVTQQCLVIQQRHREQVPQAALLAPAGVAQTGAVFVHMGKSPLRDEICRSGSPNILTTLRGVLQSRHSPARKINNLIFADVRRSFAPPDRATRRTKGIVRTRAYLSITPKNSMTNSEPRHAVLPMISRFNGQSF